MITLKTSELVATLKAAHGFASADFTLPLLQVIRLHVDTGQLYATATDRYKMGQAKTEVAGHLGAMNFLLKKDDGKQVVATLRTDKGDATLEVVDDKLNIKTGGTAFTFTPEEGKYPAVENLWPTETSGWELTGPVGFKPEHLKPLLDLHRDRHEKTGETLRFFIRDKGRSKQVLVTYSHHFRAVLMPVTMPGDSDIVPHF